MGNPNHRMVELVSFSICSYASLTFGIDRYSAWSRMSSGFQSRSLRWPWFMLYSLGNLGRIELSKFLFSSLALRVFTEYARPQVATWTFLRGKVSHFLVTRSDWTLALMLVPRSHLDTSLVYWTFFASWTWTCVSLLRHLWTNVASDSLQCRFEDYRNTFRKFLPLSALVYLPNVGMDLCR